MCRGRRSMRERCSLESAVTDRRYRTGENDFHGSLIFSLFTFCHPERSEGSLIVFGSTAIRTNDQRCFASLNMTGLITKGDVHVTRGLHHLAVRRDQLDPIDSFRDRHLTHLIILVANHRTKMSFVGKLDSFHAKTRSENSI